MPIFDGRTSITGNLGVGSGLGQNAPSGVLHAKGSSAGFLVFSVTGINSSTPLVILSEGSITLFLQTPINGIYINGHSSGPRAMGLTMAPTGQTIDYTVDLYNELGELIGTQTILRFTCNTNGNFTVHRVIGSGTYQVHGILFYL